MMGLMAHWIDEEFELHYAMDSLKKHYGTTASVVLAQQLIEWLADKKMVALITDAAAEMVHLWPCVCSRPFNSSL